MYFNSIKVRLEQLIGSVGSQLQANFNSIKVRLEQMDALCPLDETTFQFHKGAIRTRTKVLTLFGVTSFQFHKGAIRTHLSWTQSSNF